jgi:16S rRNA (guanine1207-N2)-methyltransferase
MTHDRLSFAIAPGDLPPAGRIALIGAPAGAAVGVVPRAQAVVVQPFRPDHDAWAAAGHAVTPEPDGVYAAAILFVPRARAAAWAMVAAAVAHVAQGGPIWVDGQKTDGIDTVLRDLKGRVALSDPVAKAHGRIARFASPGAAAFADWVAADSHPAPGFVAPPGAFSADGVDPGSAALAAALPAQIKGRVADLGAGWGWLSAQVLARADVTELHLVEADHAALAAARLNVTDPRARFHWADATRFAPDRRFDAAVMNPPFHTGRAADPGLGAAFIAAAAGMLTLSGVLFMVANRHLPYAPVLAARFREVAEIAGDGRFRIIRAARPVPAGRR